MRERITIRSFSPAVFFVGVFFVLWAASPSKKQSPCKGSMEQCCQKNNSDEGNKMSWETLPHQFFSSVSFN
jgi:hypothetical protein